MTLIQVSAIIERWGATHYGRLNALMSAPVVIVMALAPWAGTVLTAATSSYATTYLVLAVIAVVVAIIASPPFLDTERQSTLARAQSRSGRCRALRSS